MPGPNILASHLRDIIHPLVLLLTKSRVKFQVTWEQPPAQLMDKPVIFAVNHTNSFDSPIAAKAISHVFGRRCYLLVGKQRLWFSDKLWFFLNGTIWVDRANPAEMSTVKDTIINYLRQGQSIMWFPEGTWNLTDNLLMLPMKWGIIDVAVRAEAQIVPTVLDYDRETMICSVRFGIPMAPDSTINLTDAICDLRNAMASLRWTAWEQKVPLQKGEIDRAKLKQAVHIALEEYSPIDWDYEKRIIFWPNPSPEEVFIPIDSLEPRWENAFLFAKDRL